MFKKKLQVLINLIKCQKNTNIVRMLWVKSNNLILSGVILKIVIALLKQIILIVTFLRAFIFRCGYLCFIMVLSYLLGFKFKYKPWMANWIFVRWYWKYRKRHVIDRYITLWTIILAIASTYYYRYYIT